MALNDLVDCIEVLKSRMQSHRVDLEENETRTRMALIDPLLCALGWDVSDPAMVTPEYKVGNKSADYALLRPDGVPAATFEAKRLGESLTSHQHQMLTYANIAGINYTGITDGDHWELYKVFEAGPLPERRILKVSIANAPAHASALKLLTLWRPNLMSGVPVPASTPILEDQQANVVLPQGEPTPAPQPLSSNWVALSEYNLPAGAPHPLAIRLWDGSERQLTYWNEILVCVVEKLYADGRLAVKDLPIGWSRSTYSVHTEAVHPTGKAFANAVKIEGTPLIVNVNLNAKQVRVNTARLLERYGLSPSAVSLTVRRSEQENPA